MPIAASPVRGFVSLTMSSLHHRAKEVFLAVLDGPATDRSARLAAACGTDAALRHEVESLLSFHDDDAGPRHTGSSPDVRLAPGEVFDGRYQMITRIGQGGMGDVWREEDLVLQ